MLNNPQNNDIIYYFEDFVMSKLHKSVRKILNDYWKPEEYNNI